MPKPGRDATGTAVMTGAGAADEMARVLAVRFGENLRHARIRTGLTQRDIETRTGIRQQHISLIEGGRHNPTLATMAILADAVGSDVPALLRPAAGGAR